MAKKKIVMIEISIIAVLVAAIVVLLIVMFGGKKDEKTDKNAKKTTEERVEYIDADAFYKENSTVIDKTSAGKSKKAYTEKDIAFELKSRGFEEDVRFSYGMNGEYLSENVASNKETMHPEYSTLFTNENGEMWSVNVVNDQIIAYPVAYNYEGETPVEVYVAEENYITGYDNATNTFYEVKPNETMAKIIVVDKIDSDTLNQLTVKELKNR